MTQHGTKKRRHNATKLPPIHKRAVAHNCAVARDVFDVKSQLQLPPRLSDGAVVTQTEKSRRHHKQQRPRHFFRRPPPQLAHAVVCAVRIPWLGLSQFPEARNLRKEVPGGISHLLEGMPKCLGRGSGGALVKVVLLEEAEVVGSRLPGNAPWFPAACRLREPGSSSLCIIAIVQS